MLPAVAKILQSALVKDIVKEFEDAVQEGAISEAKKHGIKATSLEDVVKQATNKYVQSKPVESINVKSIDDLVETQKVTNEHLAQILDQLRQSNGLESKRQRDEIEERIETRHREGLVERMKSVGAGMIKNTSGGVLSTVVALVSAVAGYGVMKFFASDFFKTISEKGIGGYLEEKWESVKETVASGFMLMLESAKNKIRQAGEWMAESFSNLVRFAVDIVDGIKSYIKSQPWVPDFVKDMLGETRVEAASKKQYEEDQLLKKQGEAQSLLMSTNKAIDQEKQIIGARVAAMSQSNRWTPEQTKAYADEQMASPRMAELEAQKQKYERYIEHNAPAVEQINQQRASQVDAVTQAAPVVSGASGGASALLDLIGQKESRGNYNALVYGNGTPTSADLTNMTLDEVFQYQSGMRKRGHASTAVGKYQFIKATLQEAAAATGISGSTKFTPEVQDRLAMYLLNRRGWSKFKSGQMSKEEFALNLSKEWASFPKDASGVSFYDGVAGNKAGVKWDTVMATLGGETSGSAVSGVVSSASISPAAPSSSGESLTAAQTQQAQTQQEIAQSPAQVQVINNPTAKDDGLASITVALRNDDPSYKKIIEQLAMNALGITGSPLANV